MLFHLYSHALTLTPCSLPSPHSHDTPHVITLHLNSCLISPTVILIP